MAPEVIACDENPDATYDNRVSDQEWDEYDTESAFCSTTRWNIAD